MEMSHEHTKYFSASRPIPIEPLRSSQTQIGHQYSATFLDGSSSAHFGDVYRQYYGDHSNYEIDRSCLQALRCPDSFVVKTRLKENKDKLLHDSFDWVFRDLQYIRWQDGSDTGLLWIKGGAGKGKTMMSIGLIEALSQRPRETTAVTYFFCQNADYELNKIEAIIKGLIRQLVRQQESLIKSLRDRWDPVHKRFSEDVSSWRGLWNIFMEMLEHCPCPRVYIVVDALDECRDEGMADLLRLIVRTGLGHLSKIKWLLTSRPLDSAERELLTGSEQVRVSLELNAQHIAQGVRRYISHKVAELDQRCGYGPRLRHSIEDALTFKAENTFLWVSLVCKRLEKVHGEEALATIRDLPPDLNDFYHRMLAQLRHGESPMVEGCMRLLQVMMLAYRPLHVREVSSVTGLHDELGHIERLIDRSASFVKRRGTYVEFVHQSTRDYLAGTNGHSPLEVYDQYGHGEIAVSCLAHLFRDLKINLLDLPRPDSTRPTRGMIKEGKNELLASLDYAATFWVQHVDIAKNNTIAQDALAGHGEVERFLCTRLLEWLECLSLLDQLPRAVEAMNTLADMAGEIVNSSPLSVLSELVQDATRFLLRHYQTVSAWPLQIYSSAVVFSPKQSMVRRANIDRIPCWLTQLPTVEEEWTPLVQTLVGHSDGVKTVVFSPDGRYIASGSRDRTIKVWDTTTGEVQKTLAGHSDRVNAVAFSPDGRHIASGSEDRTIKVWDTTTGEVQKTLAGHSDRVYAVVFSPDGRHIASGSEDHTIMVWDAATGEVQKTLAGHSDRVNAIAFSPDGRHIASGSEDRTIKVWDTTTGEVQKTLAGHSDRVKAVAFSPDGRHIASGSEDYTIKVWDTTTGEVQKTLAGHSHRVDAVAFSPNGQHIASGFSASTIKVWDVMTGRVKKKLAGHSDEVNAVVFSPDGRHIASGSRDRTIKVWDTTMGEVQKTLAGHSDRVNAVAFSPDGRHIASGSGDRTIKVWDTTMGEVQKTLAGHSDRVYAVVFSPDGRYIASGSEDYTIKVWDAATGEVQKTLAGHSDRVKAVAFSPDGRHIASGSWDNTIKIWDATTEEVYQRGLDHSQPVNPVALTPDSRRPVFGSNKKITTLWDVVRASKSSRWLGSALGRPPKFQTSQEIDNFASVSELRAYQVNKASGPVSRLHFSADGTWLATNVGVFKVGLTAAERQRQESEPAQFLYVRDQWIHFGPRPVLRLPADSEARCDDVNGNQFVIGFGDGRVLSFTIDCRNLLQTLDT